MENGYNIFWTPNALSELEQTIEYLQNNFTDKEIKKLVHKLESITEIISKNPNIFPKSEDKNIHKAVILEFNTMYYRVRKENIEILSFFSNRQSPQKKKF
ncbi:type II toxin-antitoxin system RelE/ParE family toxin [Chryseobacterium sp. MYb264]|uniref:type II toxin-antitoxin system RelE/ParE family toxin n=1 Tax=Chryseobacterium sp. MYb264 TaxID=2745153 RepID=UPI002E156038|nr:type II toxin-antitoxin system RelE/ParE family toxin [Chryseobacterium sp. MYb264]